MTERIQGAIALGTYDLLHIGHVLFLKAARNVGGHLTVAVNPDDFCARYKRPPVIPLDDRVGLLSELRCVDRVVVNTGREDSKPAILESRARFVVHGDDWTGDAYMEQLGVTAEWLEHHGIVIRHVPYTAGVSTTDIIRRCGLRR